MTQRILVKPNKKADKVYWQEAGLFDEQNQEKTIVVETTAPPLEGKANKKVVELVAEFLGISKSQISIKSGKTSKFKLLNINK